MNDGTPQFLTIHNIAKIMLLHDRNPGGAHTLIKQALTQYTDDANLNTDFVISEYMLGNKTEAVSLMKELYTIHLTKAYYALYQIFRNGLPLPKLPQ